METKRCSCCCELKSISEFRLDRGKPRSKCAPCDRQMSNDSYHRNKEKHKEKRRLYHLQRYPSAKEEQQRKVREKTKTPEYREKNNKRLKEKRDSNPVYRMKLNMRRRCLCALKGQYKFKTTYKLIGCSVEELRIHLESKFLDGMNWDNYGMYGWHVDHIIPVSSFDLSTEEGQKQAFHYTNLQPLWAKDNLSKSAKL